MLLLQVAAALLALQALPGSAAGADMQLHPQLEPQLQQQLPKLQPELERLLQQPGSNAQELYALWQGGVPLEVLGSMHSGNMPVSDDPVETRGLEVLMRPIDTACRTQLLCVLWPEIAGCLVMSTCSPRTPLTHSFVYMPAQTCTSDVAVLA